MSFAVWEMSGRLLVAEEDAVVLHEVQEGGHLLEVGGDVGVVARDSARCRTGCRSRAESGPLTVELAPGGDRREEQRRRQQAWGAEPQQPTEEQRCDKHGPTAKSPAGCTHACTES